MDVAKELQDIVEEYGVEPSRLRIEITETVMMQDNENRIDILNQLKQSGFLVEMDDFGSGFSSLNMLKDMPVDVIKIDMLFLRQTQQDDRGQTILHNVMNLTNDLGLSSLTEGVETEAQYNMLLKMGCKLFQGYYFSRPIPVDQFETTFSLQK
jgi:EAL domain-containing protein (putative c-di-GMP-specific phosphodiesterase class I)